MTMTPIRLIVVTPLKKHVKKGLLIDKSTQNKPAKYKLDIFYMSFKLLLYRNKIKPLIKYNDVSNS